MAPRAGDDDVGPHAKGVFAGADWYLERPEPEHVLRGVLRRRPTAVGPGDRSALAFTLVTDEGPLPVYAAGVERVLGGFEGQTVVIRGKVVDLRAEGFESELWIGSLDAADGAEAEDTPKDQPAGT